MKKWQQETDWMFGNSFAAARNNALSPAAAHIPQSLYFTCCSAALFLYTTNLKEIELNDCCQKGK